MRSGLPMAGSAIPQAFAAAGVSPEEVPPSAWTTPSRYAWPLRARMEEGVRIVGSHLAQIMAAESDTLITVSGDGEVELNFERNIAGGEHLVGNAPIYADYSPYMVEEFRDWVVNRRYAGDRSPASDDNHDGHTFNQDFETSFATWQLRYFDNSGPISLVTYLKMTEKLPSGGPYFIANGFDAPRTPDAGNAFWNLWMEFREQSHCELRPRLRSVDFAPALALLYAPDPGGFSVRNAGQSPIENIGQPGANRIYFSTGFDRHHRLQYV
jgi:hypothetical protein